ncbi:MAG: fimbrial protein [Pseudomonadota bacterium]
MAYDDLDEQPLDPVMERVRKKMVRLMVISIGIMMVGLFAVLFAIIYKFNNPTDESAREVARVPGQVTEINLGLPSDARILSTVIEESKLVIDVEVSGNKRQLIVVDTNTGQLISRINLN